MKINFKYPSFAIGFHSGWCEQNNSPTTKLILTRRKKISLVKDFFKVIMQKDENTPPFFVKSLKGDKDGLSSGAGSSILEFNGNYFKIKRNGYKKEGFIKRNIPDREFTLNKGLNEASDYEDAGVFTLEDALREIKIEKELDKIGLIIPQKTVALYSIRNPFGDDDSVALIQKIDTELRTDEYCSIVLTNLFYDVFKDNCKIDLKESRFIFGKYSLKKAIQIFEKKYARIFFQIGQNIGFIYRKIHESGYVRGIGNSWYGNELICEDGNIGVCDLESCFSKKEIADLELFHELKKTDIHLARTAFYDSMNYFENSLASFVGIKLIEGFNRGYNEEKYVKLDPEEIKRQIIQFIKIKKKIIKEDD